MQKEAEMHADEDKKKREIIDARNMAEALIYSTEKALRDAGDKVKAEDKKPIEEKVEALKKVKDGEDKAAIDAATQELSTAAQKIGEQMYKEQSGGAATPKDGQGPGSAGQTTPNENKSENVVDAEVVEEKKEEEK